MLKQTKYRFLILACFACTFWSCSKDDSAFRDFLGGKELVFPGNLQNVKIYPGNKRVLFTWNPSTDPSIASYKIYWNNLQDSVSITPTSLNPADTISYVLENLDETLTNFTIYSYDAAGNRSTKVEVSNVRIYGDIYHENLYNRVPGALNYDAAAGTLTTNWNIADTVNVRTDIIYTNKNNEVKTIALQPDSTMLILPDWKYGSQVFYQSFYKPTSNAIDTFAVKFADSLDSKIKEMTDQLLAGDYRSVGTLDRPDVATLNFDEVKPISYLGQGVFKFQIAPSVFGNDQLQIYLSINNDNTVTILPLSGSEASLSVVSDGACTFDPVTNQFKLKYKYVSSSGAYRKIDETLTKQ